MKHAFLLLLLILLTSCEVTETLHINPDNSGTIEFDSHRNESSYMQIAGEEYSKETVFKDTTYVFQEYIDNYNANFIRYTSTEQALFNSFKNVKVHIKKSAFDKEFRTTITQAFKKVEDIADLSKTENYADDIKHNYALTAEEHYYNIRYTLNGNHFNRIVTITDENIFQKEKDKMEEYKKRLASFKLVQTYTLNYHFSYKIKSVSNSNAVISPDKKSLELQFLVFDFLQNPESTNLDVILE
ncbi:hypothetical protein [Flavobacterium frigoris]|uniref:Lipoprotein n=1 Tax=Flavobacterium frigoris (strain PS1) TaxID=1086011 RepID=H7FR70_FLAFP|nr:hypothetical protein [Flavobacterium frigoris]EIA08853.1 hypothetical protein HJ01_01619 [Flavobacterium frigoris PS1]